MPAFISFVDFLFSGQTALSFQSCSFDVFHKNSRLLRNICESYLWFVHFLQFPKKKKRKKEAEGESSRFIDSTVFVGRQNIHKAR